MLFAVLFEDNPAAGSDIRARYMPDHLAFLDRHKTEIVAAGPLSELDSSAAGGLWLVQAAGDADVQTLVEEDPFWPTGLRKSVRILHWQQVFANGKRLVEM